MQGINNILVYKRTHVGDPNLKGEFGVNDCMGRIREYLYDAVIGIGGVTSWLQNHTGDIRGKVNWVGIKPRVVGKNTLRGRAIIGFDSFLLLEGMGPLLTEIVPCLYKLFCKPHAPRSKIITPSHVEYDDVSAILKWSKSQTSISKHLYSKWYEPEFKEKGCKQIKCKTYKKMLICMNFHL